MANFFLYRLSILRKKKKKSKEWQALGKSDAEANPYFSYKYGLIDRMCCNWEDMHYFLKRFYFFIFLDQEPVCMHMQK